MSRKAAPAERMDDVQAATEAVLTASRLLVAVSARSLAEVEERVTLPQFRMLVVLSSRGDTKLVTLAELLGVAPSTAMRMIDRLITAGLADRQTNPDNRRETLLRLTTEGRRTVENVTARPARGDRLDRSASLPGQRTALISALTDFNSAGGERPARPPDDSPGPIRWAGARRRADPAPHPDVEAPDTRTWRRRTPWRGGVGRFSRAPNVSRPGPVGLPPIPLAAC
ncbi:hypothetical protein STANM309S_06221 [Streptomyces tanashiensis]